MAEVEIEYELYQPRIHVISGYLMIFPDSRSKRFFLVLFNRVMMRGNPVEVFDLDLEITSPSTGKGPLETQVVLTKPAHFYLLDSRDGEATVREFLLTKDAEESGDGFKFPLMFVGILIAFGYNLFFRDNSSRFKSKKAKDRSRLNKEIKRLNKISKR